MSSTANEQKRQRVNALERSGATQIPDDCHRALVRDGWMDSEAEARCDAAIAKAKAELRELCDRTRGPDQYETPVVALRDLGIKA